MPKPSLASLDKRQRAALSKLGANVRRERIKRGLTQEALAELSSLHPRMVQKIEAGHVNILVTTALRLQEALLCPLDLLLPSADLHPSAEAEHMHRRLEQFAAKNPELRAFLDGVGRLVPNGRG